MSILPTRPRPITRTRTSGRHTTTMSTLPTRPRPITRTPLITASLPASLKSPSRLIRVAANRTKTAAAGSTNTARLYTQQKRPAAVYAGRSFFDDRNPRRRWFFFDFNLPQNRHSERSASQIYRVTQACGAESEEPVPSAAEGTPTVLILPILLGAFRPPKPGNSPLR